MKKPVRFTMGEGEFLAHRLQMPEALAEVIAADDQDDDVAKAANDENEVRRLCTEIQAWIETGIPVYSIVKGLSPLGAAILRDVVEGSTYVACLPADDPDADADRRAAVRVARSAVKKLRDAGFEVADAPEM